MRDIESQRRITTTSVIIVMAFLLPMLSVFNFNTGDDRQDLSADSQVTSTYPNSDWLVVWQTPNASEIGAPYGHEGVVTPQMTMDYYGTTQLQIVIPTQDYLPGWGHKANYYWDEIADRSLFPNNCKLWVGFNNMTNALDISEHAANDSRIVGGWIDDFGVGSISPETMMSYHENLTKYADIKLFMLIYDAGDGAYWNQTPYTWSSILPYFDGVFFTCLERTYDQNSYHHLSWYEAVKDLRTYIPGKEIYAHMYNHHYNEGTFQWDMAMETVTTNAQLYREGVIQGISLLTNVWIIDNFRLSNAQRSVFNTEFRQDYQTTVDLDSLEVTTEMDGIPTADAAYDLKEKWNGNFTFWSRHTQMITFVNNPGANMTVKDLLTGDVYECQQNPEIQYVARMGHMYQVYSFPHTHLHYELPHPNLYFNTTSSINDTEILVDGWLYVNDNLTMSNVVIRFNNARYDDSLRNMTAPQQGFHFVSTAKTWKADNCTIEPLLRQFTYRADAAPSVSYLATFIWHNTTLAGYDGPFKPTGIFVGFYDCLFSCASWGEYFSQPSGVYNGQSFALEEYWMRNVFWLPMRYFTVSFWVTPIADYWEPYYFGGRHDGNIVVGGWYTLIADLEGGDAGEAWLNDTQVYPAGFYKIGDDAWGDRWTEDGEYSPHIIEKYDENCTRITFSDVVWTDKILHITTSFRIDGPVNFSGTLKDATGSTIGSYDSINGVVSVSKIEEVKCLYGTRTEVHPFPWTFTITSTLSDSYYWGVTSIGGLGINRTARFDPWLLEIDDLVVTIWPEDANNLHLVRMDREIYQGVPTTVHDNNTLDMGQYLMAWTSAKYQIPVQIPMSVDTSGDVEVNVTSYTPSAALVASWTATASSGASATFTMTALSANTIYTVWVDGNHVATLTSSAVGVISFDYSAWSTHVFEVLRPSTYTDDDDSELSDDRSPSSSDTGATSLSLSSLSMIAVASASVLILVVVLTRRSRGGPRRSYR